VGLPQRAGLQTNSSKPKHQKMIYRYISWIISKWIRTEIANDQWSGRSVSQHLHSADYIDSASCACEVHPPTHHHGNKKYGNQKPRCSILAWNLWPPIYFYYQNKKMRICLARTISDCPGEGVYVCGILLWASLRALKKQMFKGVEAEGNAGILCFTKLATNWV